MLISVILSLFIIANPIGNSPAILAMIKDFSFAQQKKIMLREALIAFLLAITFQYAGEIFLSSLNISASAVSLCGGILLLFCALDMIFSSQSLNDGKKVKALKQEPFLVPIATPLISGPGVLTMIMVYSQQLPSLTLTFAIFITWTLIALVMVSSPYIQLVLKRRGMGALEQLMGMILTMISVEMMVSGVQKFMTQIG